jgi:phospholipid transport system substrate-binding protein
MMQGVSMNPRRLIRIGLLLAAWLALSGAAKPEAPPPAQAAELIVQSFQSATAALREHQQQLRDDPQAAKQLMLEILAPYIDFDLLARLVLGPHWRTAAPAERTRFVTAFHGSLVDTYAIILATNMDRVLAVLDSGGVALTLRRLVTGDDPRRVTVRTLLNLGDQAVAADFQLNARTGRWLIHDVVIEGISFAASRRSEFAGLLQNQSLEQVIERLETGRR